MRNFLTTSDFSLAELAEIIEVAIEFKTGKIAVSPPVGKSIALVFFNLLSKRASMQVGIYELVGHAVILEPV